MVTTPPAERPTITLGTRRWSHLMPLASGAVAPTTFDLRLEQRDHTPSLLREPDLAGAETSFSRYGLGISQGDDRLVGIPAFVMRAFRHRSFLVRRDSEITELTQLKGRRIGLTGWPDSGNTWTRSLLRRAGVDLSEISWVLAPLSGGDGPLERHDLPENVGLAEPGDSLVAALLEGRVEAILAPFMPPEFRRSDGPIRHLLTDYKAAEAAYYREVGFVPGIHVIALKREVVDRHPWLPAELMAVLEESKRTWFAERRHYADTTPWMLEELHETEEFFGQDWMPYGAEPNSRMVSAFCDELNAQGLTAGELVPSDLFQS